MERVFFDLDTNKIQPKGNAPFFMPQKNLFWTGVTLFTEIEAYNTLKNKYKETRNANGFKN
jgi:hypothetical protein